MAYPPPGLAQKQWDDALNRVLGKPSPPPRNLAVLTSDVSEMSKMTISRNSELENRVAELDLELSVWKQAHANVVDSAERDKKAHNALVSTLNRQIATMDLMQNQNPLILCVVDANTNLFNQSLLVQGAAGGRQVAQRLTHGIAEYLSLENVQAFQRLSFWIIFFYNRRTVLDALLGNAVCNAEQFEAFLSGFSQTSPRFQIVEVGPGRDAIDEKIKEYIQTFTRFPQTLRVFLTGGQNDAYLPTLTALQNEEMLGKLVLLEGCNEAAPELRQLALPSIRIDGLFYPGRLPVALPMRRQGFTPGPLHMVGSPGSQSNSGGMASPNSEAGTSYSGSRLPLTIGAPTVTPGKPIDPTKPLHKQAPPPCNEHYLMTCSKGPGCKYSHDWALTAEQLEILARNAKKAPCNYLKNGMECPHGDRCCWGHVCPGGSRCFHLSKGKCWFKGDGMHPPTDGDEDNTIQ